MKIIKLILLLVFSSSLFANTPIMTVDVYGSTKLDSNQLKKTYSFELNSMADILHNNKMNDPKYESEFYKNMQAITHGIKSKGDYAYVNVSPILYRNDPATHITIDVVEKRDKYRLAYFLPKPTKRITDNSQLVTKMIAYQKDGMTIILNTGTFPAFTHCPAHHCLFGFEHPALQKYLHTFDNAEQDKANLVDILRNDEDENKRAAAAFTLAHIKNGIELIKLITPSLNDSSPLVRNNVMRVIGMVALQHDVQVPIEKITTALDYPNTSDRNKALLILYSLLDKKTNAEYVIKHTSTQLINILKLQQPNNHDIAYQILKKISGKTYADRDYQSWANWLKDVRHA